MPNFLRDLYVRTYVGVIMRLFFLRVDVCMHVFLLVRVLCAPFHVPNKLSQGTCLARYSSNCCRVVFARCDEQLNFVSTRYIDTNLVGHIFFALRRSDQQDEYWQLLCSPGQRCQPGKGALRIHLPIISQHIFFLFFFSLLRVYHMNEVDVYTVLAFSSFFFPS